MMEEKIYDYLLQLGDNSMILGHRLSELCGHGPSLETDIALTNISLDLFGQVRHYFQYAAKLKTDKTEDDIAFLRLANEYRNVLLVEQPNTDFGYVICRQFLFDAFHLPLLTELVKSADSTIKAIANKSIKESRYHRIFSSEWMKRLGDGTEESHRRIEQALDHLYPFAHELTHMTLVEKEALHLGIGADLDKIKSDFDGLVKSTLDETGLNLPESKDRFAKGKEGFHSEYLGPILSEFQSTQRAYPNMEW